MHTQHRFLHTSRDEGERQADRIMDYELNGQYLCYR